MPKAPVYFEDAAALQRWFAKNAATATELIVGFMKRATGKSSVTWPEAVDEALCVGWIDGVRHRIDDERYRIRFSPRRRGSHWSLINVRRVAVLKKSGRVKPAGLAAFRARKASNSGRAAYEQRRKAELTPRDKAEFRKRPAAWNFYSCLPPGYRTVINWWVVSAKKAETRATRLAKLIDACAQGKRL